MINFNNFGKNYVWKIVAVAGVLAFMLAGQVSEAKGPKGKGPRASLISKTACALDLGDDGSGMADLVITTTLTNKSSGNTIPELRDGSNIEGTYKKQDVRGNKSFSLGTDFIAGLPQDINPSLEVSATFDLCDPDTFDNVAKARELNGTATMFYGISGGSEDSRTVTNRCTDDPDTEEVDEGGIKVDDATFQSIADACGL